MSDSAAAKAGDAILTPRKSGERVPQRYTTSTTPAEQALWTYTGSPTILAGGKCWITITAETSNARIFFKTGTSAVGITSTTGEPIPAGQSRNFWVDIPVDTFIEHVADASGAIVVTVSSVIAEKHATVL